MFRTNKLLDWIMDPYRAILAMTRDQLNLMIGLWSTEDVCEHRFQWNLMKKDRSHVKSK